MQLPFVLVGINCISGLWGGWAIRAVRTTVVFPSVQWFVWIHWDELFKTRDREKTATNKRATAWVGKFRHGWWRKDKIDWNLLEITTSQLSNFWFLSCAFRWLCGRFRSSLRSRIGIASKTQMSTADLMMSNSRWFWDLKTFWKNCLCCRLRASDSNIVKPKAIRKSNCWPTRKLQPYSLTPSSCQRCNNPKPRHQQWGSKLL